MVDARLLLTVRNYVSVRNARELGRVRNEHDLALSVQIHNRLYFLALDRPGVPQVQAFGVEIRITLTQSDLNLIKHVEQCLLLEQFAWLYQVYL